MTGQNGEQRQASKEEISTRNKISLCLHSYYIQTVREIFLKTLHLYVVGRSGWDAIPIPEDEWIELPEGGQLYELPGRRGIGIDVKTGEMRLCEKGWAVAAFIPPAHTGFYFRLMKQSGCTYTSIVLLYGRWLAR